LTSALFIYQRAQAHHLVGHPSILPFGSAVANRPYWEIADEHRDAERRHRQGHDLTGR